MIRIEAKTKLNPDKAISKAVAFFGPGGLGLKITDQSADHVHFEGGGGSVELNVCTEEKKTKVELVSQEWEYQVKEFVGLISG
jgi:hypothetical protein